MAKIGDGDGWELAPLGSRVAHILATGADHVSHCGSQVFKLLLSDSESKDDNNAREFDDCDEFQDL
jgi:hypothetical protein